MTIALLEPPQGQTDVVESGEGVIDRDWVGLMDDEGVMIRRERIMAICREIETGEYETAERIEGAIDGLMGDLV